jgi:hypothetical protein
MERECGEGRGGLVNLGMRAALLILFSIIIMQRYSAGKESSAGEGAAGGDKSAHNKVTIHFPSQLEQF